MKKKVFYLWNILVPILLGTAYYSLFCPDTFVTQWICSLLRLEWKPLLLLDASVWWGMILDGYFCDVLWAWALTFVLSWILGTEKKGLFLTGTIAMGFESVMELLQLTPLVAGVFDVRDIVVECMATFIAILILKNTKLEDLKT